MKTEIKNLCFDALDLLMPNSCVGCGRVLVKGESYVCLACHHELPLWQTHAMVTGELPLSPQHFSAAYSWLVFEKVGITQQLLHAMKYGLDPRLCQVMGQQCARQAAGVLEWGQWNALVPVPLHWRRHWKRGFNQALEVGKGISAISGLPLAPRLLQRTRNNATQTKRNRQQRASNVQGLFISRASPAQVQGKSFLLVDDVTTTGATLKACAGPLLELGALKVGYITVARAK